MVACPYNECTKHVMCDECYIDEQMEFRFKKERKNA